MTPTTQKHLMNKRTLALLAGLGIAAVACKDSTSVPNLNAVSSDALASGLTRSSTQLLVSGLVNSTRNDLSFRFVIFTETLARDFLRLDNNETRYISETLGGPADPSGFIGGGAFTQFFVTIRAANTLQQGLAGAQGLSAAEKSATLGLAQTLKALAYYRALETRDTLGIPLDVFRDITDKPAPFVCKPSALAFISVLLDSARTNLAAGGATFPFVLPSGYAGFTTPSSFLKFTNGLKGKVEVYRGLDHKRPNAASFDAAIAALNASFLDVNGSMSTGVYNTYSTSAGEQQYPLADNLTFLNPQVSDSIQAGDLRAAKIYAVTPKTLAGVTARSKTTVTDPANLTRPLPILKNSELILLRAQAEIGKGDLVSATADINAVRVKDGGLAPYPLFTTARAAIDAVLYEKRYSLLGEGPQRLVDLRAYSRLNGTFFAKILPGDIFQDKLPIPIGEINARLPDVINADANCP